MGILKGFAGLGGAILTQDYALIQSPKHANLILLIAIRIGPFMVAIAMMFIIRPLEGHKQVHPSDGRCFTFVYSSCLLLAMYLIGVTLVEDLVELSYTVIVTSMGNLLVLLLLPILIPMTLSFFSELRPPLQEHLLPGSQSIEPRKSEHDSHEVIFSEVEDEKPNEVDLIHACERSKRIAQLQAKLFQAAAEGAMRGKRQRGPHRGEDFTLSHALIKADFWLVVFSLLLGSGSGLTTIDNLDQLSSLLVTTIHAYLYPWLVFGTS